MKIQEMREIVEGAKLEIDRLLDIVETPERILGEFYKAYNENLLQCLLEFMNYSEDELYDTLIEQLGKMDVLSNCKITKTGTGHSTPLLISYRKPEFRLLVIDIKGKKFENVFESVVRGLQFNIKEAESTKRTAAENLAEFKDIDMKIRQLANGDYDLRKMSALGRKNNIKRYLGSLEYTKDEIIRIVDDLRGYLETVGARIDQRQAILADAEMRLSEAIDKRREYDDNPFLQNAVADLTSILVNSGYEVKQNIYTGPVITSAESEYLRRISPNNAATEGSGSATRSAS